MFGKTIAAGPVSSPVMVVSISKLQEGGRGGLMGVDSRVKMRLVDAGLSASPIDGTEAFGTESFGTEADGTEAVGTESFGTEADGTDASGTESAGTGADGAEAPSTALAHVTTASALADLHSNGIGEVGDFTSNLQTNWLEITCFCELVGIL